MKKLLNDCRYCDNKGSNCARHKDVPAPPVFRVGPTVFVEKTVAYTSVSDRQTAERLLWEEEEDNE